ncbi:glycosyl hydrolase 53 family protein [Paenibacillus sp. PK3_47]|uniref:glycosyl hydrolase 53 family protein n=1 Tax=Paenibacillus sp. PK3_47 TaxID=2072642 RepID=UPI00201D3DB3|nr:glycosyl hydrolase 53 family protein [Paenibacillus sp. PK3_47]
MNRSSKQGLRAGFHLILACVILIGLFPSTGWANAEQDTEPGLVTDYIRNGSFENGITSWDAGVNPAVTIQSGWAPQGGGDKRLSYWSDSAFTADTHQTVTGLTYGNYMLSAWIDSSGGFNQSYMYASSGNAPDVKIDIPASSGWSKIDLPVTVSSDTLKIGFYADGPANKWISFDLVSLTSQQQETAPIPAGIAIVNRGFEDEGTAGTAEGWSVEGDEGDSAISESGYKSGHSLRHGNSDSYQVSTFQTISNVEEGYYTLTGWTRSSGGQKANYLFAKNNGTSESRTAIPVRDEWTKVTVRGIHVTTGNITFGLYSDASGGSWSQLDDVELIKDDKPYRLLKGGDTSEITYVESMGGKYYDRNGIEKDLFQILKENGQDIVRLRLYNNPGKGRGDGTYYVPEGIMDKADILKQAKRAKDAGLQIQLSFHYSDYWTNGSLQYIPHEWQEQISGLASDAAKVDKLEELLAGYTVEVMQAMKDQGTTPEYVSLGNEMQSGILYPYGRAGAATWENLARFLTAGSNAVKSVSPSTQVILHLDDAGNYDKYEGFFDKAEELAVPYDIIGPSYYPFWTNKTIQQMVEFCNDMSEKYDKDIMIMETGYNWNPTVPNGSPGQLTDNGPYPMDSSTPEGQKNFMIELFNALKSANNGRIIGDLYWDPIMIEVPGVGWALKEADDQADINAVSNTTLFDFEGRALPVHDAYSQNADGSTKGLINGVIRGKSGNRLSGVEILADIHGAKRRVVTDSNGNYLIPDVPVGGGYTLSAAKAGYQGGMASVSAVVYGEITTADIEVSGGAVSGIVRDEQGRLVKDAVISVSGAGIVHSVRSSEKGEYTLGDLPEGQPLTITASKPGFTSGSQAGVEVLNGQVTRGVDLDIVLSSGTIQGKVTDRQNVPVAGAKVQVTAGSQKLITLTDATGSYTLLHVPAGQSYTVTAAKNNYVQSEIREVSVSVGQVTAHVDFAMDLNLGRLSGTVTNSDNEPVPGAEVTAVSGEHIYRTVTDSAGKYSLPDMLAGILYQLTAEKAGYMDGTLAEVKVEALKDISDTHLRMGTEVPIVNGGFETQGTSQYDVPGWTLEGTEHASYVQKHSAVRQGEYALSSWMEGAYVTKASQTVTGLTDGDYVVSASFYSGGGQKEYYMFAQPGSGDMAKLNIPATGGMTAMNLKVAVTGGELTFGFQADAIGGNWALVDDVKLGYLGQQKTQPEAPVTTPTPTPSQTPATTPTPSPAATPTPASEVPLSGGISGTPMAPPSASPAGVKIVGGTVTVTTTSGTDGIAKAVISADDLTAAVNAAAGELKIAAIPDKAAAGVQLQFPAAPVTGKHALTSVTIDTGLAAISLHPSLLLKTDASPAGNILLTVVKSDTGTLPPDVKNQLGTADVLDITLSIDGVPADLRGGTAQVALPYTLQPGQQPQNIVVYSINDNGALEIIKNGGYELSSGKVSFKVKHFSKYAAAYSPVSFSDLSTVPWAQASIEALAARDIIKGTAAEVFSPARNITRAEFVSMLLGAFDLKGSLADSSFSDVPEDSWYAAPAAAAEQLGIIQGRADGTFAPEESITRQDMAVMIYKAAQAVKITLGKGQFGVSFTDRNTISGYASEAVRQLASEGIINGMGNGSFAPKKHATRAEAAVIINRLLNME